jgi:hypothetical protein
MLLEWKKTVVGIEELICWEGKTSLLGWEKLVVGLGEVGCWEDAGLLDCGILNAKYGIKFNAVVLEAVDRVLLFSWSLVR